MLESTRRRHHRARQDRHGHDRPDEPGRRDVTPRHRRDEALRLAGALEHASEHPVGARSPAPPATRRPGRRRGLPQPSAASAWRASSTAAASSSAGPRCSPRALHDAASSPRRDAPSRRAHRRRSPRGTARRARCFVVADTVKPTSAEAVDALTRLGLRPVLLTGDNAATARAVAAEVGIDEVIAEVLPADKAAVVRACRTRAASSRWSATASTTRPRSRRPTSAWRSAPAPTWRSRPPT